eukprot:GDKH01010633.1.p1 GENE.GDKH01010633.1~~GDKH01010633.1.p1  ORF type:complete len:253 (-),score=66.68 GDKH01010633.1:214-972(-)
MNGLIARRAAQMVLQRSIFRTPAVGSPLIGLSVKVSPAVSFAGMRHFSAEASEKKAEDATKPETTEPAADDSKTTDLAKKLAELEKSLEEEKAARQEGEKEMKDRLARALADAENARRIHRREVDNANRYAVAKFAASLLDVADTLHLATKHVDDMKDKSEDLTNMIEGVKLTQQLLHKAFEKHGVEPVDAVGEQFDPNMHEALFEVEDPTKTRGQVADVMQRGYRIHDRVLRAAKVGIFKGGPPPPANNDK